MGKTMTNNEGPVLNVVVGRRPSLLMQPRSESTMTGEIFVFNSGIFEDEYYLSTIIPHDGEKTSYNNEFNLAAVTIEYLYEMHRRCVIFIAQVLLQHGYSDGKRHSLDFYESLAQEFNNSRPRLDLEEAFELHHKEMTWRRDGQVGEATRTTTLDPPLTEDHFNLFLPSKAKQVEVLRLRL